MKISARALVSGLVVTGIVAALVIFKSGSHEKTPNEILEEVVVHAARAAEKHQLADVMEGVSEQYRAGDGWSKQELKSYLAAQILRGEWLRVFIVGLTPLESTPTTIRWEGKFVFGRSEAKSVQDLPKDSVLGSYLIEGVLTREADGRWRVTRTTHRPIPPGDIL